MNLQASEEPVLRKMDVARRQLATAIQLLFDDGDLVSILTLAANAWEIIDALCVLGGIDSMSVQARTNVPAGKDLKFDYINAPYRNFFKHADRDPLAELPPPTASMVDGLIYLATEDYLRLNKGGPLEMQVFQLWYLSCNVEKIRNDAIEKVLESIEGEFPNIRGLERARQLVLGRKSLCAAYGDTALTADAQTEKVR